MSTISRNIRVASFETKKSQLFHCYTLRNIGGLCVPEAQPHGGTPLSRALPSNMNTQIDCNAARWSEEVAFSNVSIIHFQLRVTIQLLNISCQIPVSSIQGTILKPIRNFNTNYLNS
jgi:hypothetical protein